MKKLILCSTLAIGGLLLNNHAQAQKTEMTIYDAEGNMHTVEVASIEVPHQAKAQGPKTELTIYDADGSMHTIEVASLDNVTESTPLHNTIVNNPDGTVSTVNYIYDNEGNLIGTHIETTSADDANKDKRK